MNIDIDRVIEDIQESRASLTCAARAVMKYKREILNSGNENMPRLRELVKEILEGVTDAEFTLKETNDALKDKLEVMK